MEEFRTVDLDLAAVIQTDTFKDPEVFKQPGQSLVSFVFPNNPRTQAIVMSYASGDLVLNVKRFASCRARLYRLAKAVR